MFVPTLFGIFGFLHIRMGQKDLLGQHWGGSQYVVQSLYPYYGYEEVLGSSQPARACCRQNYQGQRVPMECNPELNSYRERGRIGA